MKTLIIKINPKKPEKNKILKAAQILKMGGLVAFPTDTVYGLGADATNSIAAKKIFKVKKRPLKKALPILIAKKTDLKKYSFTIPGVKKLINKFWPGPLTIILKKKKIISDAVTARKKSVGVRVPANAVALALIKTLNLPLATTSANISDRKSPTTASAVKKYLNNKIDLILNGGKTRLRKESTVLDCTTLPPTVTRSGAIPIRKIKKIIGKIKTGR